jgi:hypothetical protein
LGAQFSCIPCLDLRGEATLFVASTHRIPKKNSIWPVGALLKAPACSIWYRLSEVGERFTPESTSLVKKLPVHMKIRLISLWCALATLTACGGGGGGGGGGSEGDSTYGVRALHAAIDGAPVDIASTATSSPVLSQQFFAGTKSYRSLPTTAQTLSLTRTGAPGDVIGSFAVTVAPQERYSVLLYGDTSAFGLRTRLIKDEVPATVDGAVLRVVNGVSRAADVTVTVGGAASEVVAFGENTTYIPTSAGSVNVVVVRSADGYPVQIGPVELKPGKAYTLLLAGEVGYYVKTVLLADS